MSPDEVRRVHQASWWTNGVPGRPRQVHRLRDRRKHSLVHRRHRRMRPRLVSFVSIPVSHTNRKQTTIACTSPTPRRKRLASGCSSGSRRSTACRYSCTHVQRTQTLWRYYATRASARMEGAPQAQEAASCIHSRARRRRRSSLFSSDSTSASTDVGSRRMRIYGQ
jgi:hypothetical protein